MSGETWSQEKIATLLDFLNQGMSSGQIAKHMHVTRNAVIGKVARLPEDVIKLAPFRTLRPEPNGLPRATPRERPYLSKHKKREDVVVKSPWRRGVKSARPTPLKEKQLETQAYRVLINGLTKNTCRWPMWGSAFPRLPLYCGAEVTNKPYCSKHAAVAFYPAQRKVVKK